MAPNKPTQNARPSGHYSLVWGAKEEAKGQVSDAGMFHLTSSGRVKVLWRKGHPVSVSVSR